MQNLTALENMVRIGWVSSVDEQNRTARVRFDDKAETLVSGPLKILKTPPFIPSKHAPQRTAAQKGGTLQEAFASHSHAVTISPWLPDVGECVLCLYIPKENADGFIIGGI